MLRNKYVLIIVGLLFLAVAAYNYSFFRAQKAKMAPRGPEQVQRTISQSPGVSSPSLSPAEYHPVWRRDPFWYTEGVDRTIHRAYRPASTSGIVLEGTMVEGGKGYAIISGEIVGIGDHVQGAVVTDIQEQSITVKDSKGTRTISIASEPIEKEN